MVYDTILPGLAQAFSAITAIGVYYYARRYAAKKTKPEICFMAPNVNAQMHILTEEICSLRYCSHKGFSWVLKQIDNAEKQIDVMMYFLTYAVFTDAFLRAKARGVRLRFILQFDKSDEGSEWVRLRREHISIRMMDVPISQLLHTKLLIIDQKTVVFGSMNFTFSGLTENHEELLLCHEVELIRRCRNYFNRIWELMCENDQFNVMCRKAAASGDRC